jgi:predicted esterase
MCIAMIPVAHAACTVWRPGTRAQTHRLTRAVLWLWIAIGGCRGAPAPAARVDARDATAGAPAVVPSVPSRVVPVPAVVTDTRSLPPLGHVSWLERLTLADGNVAYVTPPVGAREPRPLIVAVHGAGDRPEWSCGGWRLAASDYAFVVCPQGLKMDARSFAWDVPHTISERVRAALDAVHARFGAYIAEGPTIYAGFSQGATLASSALVESAGHFPVVVLAEGGYNLIRDPAFLRRLRASGTSRVMLVCGSAVCFQTARNAEPNFFREGIDVLTAGDALSGHNLNQRMQDALHVAWPALVRGLPNWRGFEKYLAVRGRP